MKLQEKVYALYVGNTYVWISELRPEIPRIQKFQKNEGQAL